MGRSWSGLGSSGGHLGRILRHLGQAWGDLEPAGGAKNVDFPVVVFNTFCKIELSKKNSHLGRS